MQSSNRDDTARHVVIIGAPRSGTNMLRELLCSVDGVATWPCDEINYIWRHGNVRHPSDAFTADMAGPRIREYINRKFRQVARRYSAHTVVEKTCANSLRVSFLDKILDRPKYVFIYRNGVDATASAMQRWRAKFEPMYVLRKARFVPKSDLLYYMSRYISQRLYRLRSKERALSSWGPVLPEMRVLRAQHDLAEMCALQWQGCVESAHAAFELIEDSRVLSLSYEELVAGKAEQTRRIASFLDLDADQLSRSPYLARIREDSVGKGRSRLSADEFARVSKIIAPTMQKFGYI